MLPNSSYLTKILVDAHVDDLRRAAAHAGSGGAVIDHRQRLGVGLELPITIRPAQSDDAAALSTLAERGSASVPSVPILVAEAEGELRAALSLYDGAAIAQPLEHSAWMLQLLDTRAAQLRAGRPRRRHRLLRLRTGRRRWAI